MFDSISEIKDATLTEVIFHNESNGYTVAVYENEEEQFTAVGCLPSFSIGGTYRLTGAWKVHNSYGEQFSFTSAEEILPETLEGIKGFLTSGIFKGIGIKTAESIVNKFGKETLSIIEKAPEKLIQVNGIGESKAIAIKEAFQNHRESAEIIIYFQKYGIKSEEAMKLYKMYGADTINVVTENPYSITRDLRGVGFKKADAMAIRLGIEMDSPQRIKSALEYMLNWYAGEGHTYVPQKELCEKTGEFADISIEKIEESLIEMAFEGDIQIQIIEERPVVYLMAYFLAEQFVARKITILNDADVSKISVDPLAMIAQTESNKKIVFSEHQRYAIVSALAHGVSVITGGPGTGKTTIINTIIDICNYGGLKTAIAAPTGRAAKRITETSGYPALTIHRLLEYTYQENGDTMVFGRDKENPLEYDAIIVDEASMIDILLMKSLLSAILPGTRLIIVGDADQLPSVGAGNVLRDIIDSEQIHCARLTEVFRQAQESLIIVNAHRINKGEYPEFNGQDSDFFLVRKKGEKDILETIKDLYTRRLPGYYKDCKSIRDIQVLTPMKKGLIGSINLNKELQELLNPHRDNYSEKKYGEKVFRVGDKIMQMKNNYSLEWKKLSDLSTGEGVFNGDIGYIEAVDNDEGRVIAVFDEDKYVSYDITNLDEIELAYAMTIHKSQGSEFPIVIMPLSWFPPLLATRNLLYTAVTRGKTAVVMVGNEQRMNDMTDNNSIKLRYSGLAHKIGKKID